MQPTTTRVSRFVGTWELVPAESKFEFDNPPTKATLTVRPETGGLFMRAEWLDPKAKKGELEHALLFNKPVLVNGTEVTLAVVDDSTLETIVARDGVELSRTRRTLSGDGKTMELLQTGSLPNRQTFTNVSRYRKVK
ncbi:MAG: hypothetical protein ACOZQL_34650 [Myxococcota bacterium]